MVYVPVFETRSSVKLSEENKTHRETISCYSLFKRKEKF
jgi:hypothetical protein